MASKSSGFTLIELLVVLIIIGIAASFAVVAFGDFGGKKKILISAEQLASNIRLIQHQAILEVGTLGLSLSPKGYQVYRFRPDGVWQNMPAKGVFKPVTFPALFHIVLKYPASPKANTPNVVINASGDMTPFAIQVIGKNKEVVSTLTGQQNGVIQLSKALR